MEEWNESGVCGLTGLWCLFLWMLRIWTRTHRRYSVVVLWIWCLCDCVTACGPLDRPEPVKTHLRNMIILPEMIGSVVGVYNGKVFNMVEIKPDMVGHYLGEFSITYMPVRHGRPAMGGSKDRFMP